MGVVDPVGEWLIWLWRSAGHIFYSRGEKTIFPAGRVLLSYQGMRNTYFGRVDTMSLPFCTRYDSTTSFLSPPFDYLYSVLHERVLVARRSYTLVTDPNRGDGAPIRQTQTGSRYVQYVSPLLTSPSSTLLRSASLRRLYGTWEDVSSSRSHPHPVGALADSTDCLASPRMCFEESAGSLSSAAGSLSCMFDRPQHASRMPELDRLLSFFLGAEHRLAGPRRPARIEFLY